jgi:uncharacterized protein YjgD (DUF1641 family)
MAQPIPLLIPPRKDPAGEERVAEALDKHADAIVASLELLQLLDDRGIINLLRGMVGAGDQLIGTVTTAADSPGAIGGLRNFILLTKFFAGVPPDVLKSLVGAVERGAKREKEREAPGLLHLLGRLRNSESRHAIAVALDVLESVGRGL